MILHSFLLASCTLLVSTLGLQAQADEITSKHFTRFLNDQTLMLGKIEKSLDLVQTSREASKVEAY